VSGLVKCLVDLSHISSVQGLVQICGSSVSVCTGEQQCYASNISRNETLQYYDRLITEWKLLNEKRASLISMGHTISSLNKFNITRFEVLKMLLMKIKFSQDVTTYCLASSHQCFREAFCLQLRVLQLLIICQSLGYNILEVFTL